LTEKAFPDWARNKQGTNGNLIKLSEKRYLLTIESQKDTALKFTTEIEAIMPLKTLFAFSPEDWKHHRKATLALNWQTHPPQYIFKMATKTAKTTADLRQLLQI
jgi:hypothetical protein